MGTIDKFLRTADEEQPGLNLGKTPEEEDEEFEREEAAREQEERDLTAGITEYWANQPIRVWLPKGFEVEARYVLQTMFNKLMEDAQTTGLFLDALRDIVKDDPEKLKIVEALDRYNIEKVGYSLYPPEAIP